MSQSPSSSDGSADAAGFTGGMAFNLGSDGQLEPVSMGLPGGRPSPELMGMAAMLAPFLQQRMQKNAADGYGSEKNKTEGSGSDGKGLDGSGPKLEQQGASSSTATAVETKDENKESKKKSKKAKGKAKKKSNWEIEVARWIA